MAGVSPFVYSGLRAHKASCSQRLPQQPVPAPDFTDFIIGNSKARKRACMLMEKAAETNITVSVTGETGSRTRDIFVYGLNVRTAIAAEQGTVGRQRAKAALDVKASEPAFFTLTGPY